MKGPMGLGLQVNSRGKHIAYTAGTGILPFMDLIAHLILKLSEKNDGPVIFGDKDLQQQRNDIENGFTEIDIENFSLELHTNFENEEEIIGLEMINLLTEMTQKMNMTDLFYHNCRISSRDKHIEKYNESNLHAKFSEYENSNQNIRKVWLCGPPLMQEHFTNAVNRLENPKIIYAAL